MGKDIQEQVLWVIKSVDQKNGTGGTELRILQWIVDGKPGTPMLEKRDYFFDEGGGRKAGKAKGFTAFDLMTILESIHKVGELLKIPKDRLAEQLVAATMGSEIPATVPASKSQASSSLTKKTQPSSSQPASPGAPPNVEF